jgi:hypothetical protein
MFAVYSVSLGIFASSPPTTAQTTTGNNYFHRVALLITEAWESHETSLRTLRASRWTYPLCLALIGVPAPSCEAWRAMQEPSAAFGLPRFAWVAARSAPAPFGGSLPTCGFFVGEEKEKTPLAFEY